MPEKFNAIAEIKDSITTSQISVNVDASCSDNAVESNTASWFSCCGLFSSNSERSESIGGDGIEQSESQALNLFGCCAYEQTKTSEVGTTGVEEGGAEHLTCWGLTCGYTSSCKNGVPSCDLTCTDKFELPPMLSTCGEGITQGASTFCDFASGVLSLLPC